MFRRLAVFALILFEAIWLNVIIPGHTRGCVTMPCGCCASGSAETCPATSSAGCPLCQAAAAAKKGQHTPTPSDRANCALCFFAAHLSIPPALDLSAPELLFLHYTGPEAARHLIAREVLVPFDCRGPPEVA